MFFKSLFLVIISRFENFKSKAVFNLDVDEVQSKDFSNNNKSGDASLNDTTVDVSSTISQEDVSFNDLLSIKASQSCPRTLSRPSSSVDLLSLEDYLEANRNKKRFVVRGGGDCVALTLYYPDCFLTPALIARASSSL